MPDLRPLDELRRRLAQALSLPLPLQVPRGWGDGARMAQARREVEASFNGLSAPPTEATILQAVQDFARQPQASGFTQVKHLCYGLNLPTGPDEPQLIQTPRLFGRLIDQVDAQRREPRRFRRCYQALLQSYFVYDRPLDGDTRRDTHQRTGDREFDTLRVFLKDRLCLVVQPIGRSPAASWALALSRHDNLLDTQPCDRYVGELRQGQTHSLQEVCTALGLNRQSWVWQEVILAYLRALCAEPDTAFREQMDAALDIADERTELKPSAAVARQVVSRLVVRYEASESHPEHPRLRDLSVQHVGNPWIQRVAWDAFVAHEPARQMVDGWLKSRLIRDFFELLSHDGKAEQQRLDYWLRFEPVIEDMWFVLGPAARRNQTAEFKELRRRMEGRRPALVGTTSDDNNAFVMRIGHLVMVEFGVTGNACFVHDWSRMRDDLDANALHIDSVLKRRTHVQRLPHMSGWQRRFDAAICPMIGFWPEDTRSRRRAAPPPPLPGPSPRPPAPGLPTTWAGPWGSLAGTAPPAQAPAPTEEPDPAPVGDVPWSMSASAAPAAPPNRSPSPVQHKPTWSPLAATDPTERAQALAHVLRVAPAIGMTVDDRRDKGGALWVLTAEPLQTGLLRVTLDRAGFRFRAGRGYWVETD